MRISAQNRERLVFAGEGASKGTRQPTVLLIDFDPGLAEVVGQLLEENGLAVVHSTCPNGVCDCLTATGETRPDLVLVNIARPSGRSVDATGWECLRKLRSRSDVPATKVLAYTVFDTYTLAQLGIDAHALGVRLRPGVGNPGQLADDVARMLQLRTVA